jgi:hypothetical protein
MPLDLTACSIITFICFPFGIIKSSFHQSLLSLTSENPSPNHSPFELANSYSRVSREKNYPSTSTEAIKKILEKA